MRTCSTFFVLLLLLTLSCKSKRQEVPVTVANNSEPVKLLPKEDPVVVTKCKLAGIWGISKKEDAVLVIEGDSIDYLEWDPPMKYFFKVNGDSLAVFNEYDLSGFDPEDTIKFDVKKATFLPLSYHVKELTDSTLVLSRTGASIRYIKFAGPRIPCVD